MLSPPNKNVGIHPKPQPHPARRCGELPGGLADHRRGRLGQDARAHLPDRLHALAGRAGAHRPRAHVYEQGRQGDARTHRDARSGRYEPQPVDGHLPLGFRPHPARRIRQAGLPVVVHDLRFGRREKPREARDQGAEPLGRDLQAERRRGPNLEGKKQPGHAAGLRGEQFAAGRRPRAADSAVPRHLQTVRAQMPRERRDGLRRPAAEHEYPDARLPGGTHEVPEPVPLHSRGRVPGHQLRAVRHHPAARRVARQRLRGGRRRAEHLLVPRREDREYPALPAGLSRRKAFQTGTELPFDTDDRQRRELRDREEPAPDPQKILLGRRRGRPDPCDQGLHRQRGVGAARVGHLHDRPHPRGTVQRRGRTLPHQRAVARAGRGAAQPQHPL